MDQARPRLKAIFRATLGMGLALFLAAVGFYGFSNRDRLFPHADTVVVYGRETCGITKMVREGLADKGIAYTFADIDIQAIDDELWYKLGPRFKPRRITLPVVHVAGHMLLTPTADQVQDALTSMPSSPGRDYWTLLNGADPAPQ